MKIVSNNDKFIFSTKALIGPEMFQFLVLASKRSEICKILKDSRYHNPKIHSKSTRSVTPLGIEFKDDLKENRILGEKKVGRFLPTITEKKEFWTYYFYEKKALGDDEIRSDAAHSFRQVIQKELNFLESQIWRNGDVFHSKLRVIDKVEYQIIFGRENRPNRPGGKKYIIFLGAFLIKKLRFPFQFESIVDSQLYEKFSISGFSFQVFLRSKTKLIENWKYKTEEELVSKFIKKCKPGQLLKHHTCFYMPASDLPQKK